MVSVVLIWSYMLLTMFPVGYGVLHLLIGKRGYRVRYAGSYLVCGLVCVTVYAELFSLFGRVGLAANLILCAVCAGIAVAFHGRVSGALAEWKRNFNKKENGKRGRIAVVLVLFFLFAYGTSRGLLHYDTALYHAQSIRWMEEYGAVKGLGNLHCRLAYNSASFALSALYSMAFLGGQSFHCAAGFAAFLLACACVDIAPAIRNRRLRTSDYARVMAVYYLVNIFDEMISPASDYFMVLLAFYLVIRWLDLLEKRIADEEPYALLCVLGVFLMTVKLSAALILLLTWKPASSLIRQKKWGKTAKYLGLGIATAAPYFLRNVVLSGWLVYPFTAVDLFSVPWKIPKGLADYDAKEIQVWGRGMTDVGRYEDGIKVWFPDWFRSLAGSDKLFVLLGGISVAVLAVYALGMLLKLWKRRGDLLLVQTTVALSFLFWLFTSPLIRYGCVYVYLTPAVVLGGIVSQWSEAERRTQAAARSVCAGAVLLLLLYKGAALGREIAMGDSGDYWVLQKDYENFPVDSYETEGITFYYPQQGDQVGYDSFPSSPARAEITLLGENLKDGFRSSVD